MYNDEGVVYDGENSLIHNASSMTAIDGSFPTIATHANATFTGTISHSNLTNCTGDHLALNSINSTNADFQTCTINGGNINNTSMYNTTLMNPNIHFATLNGGTLESVSLVNTVNLMPGTLITIDDYVIEATELKKMLKFIQALHKDLHQQEYKETK